MTIHQLEKEEYKLKALLHGDFVRNAKRVVILTKRKRNYVSWSFDCENYTRPTAVK